MRPPKHKAIRLHSPDRFSSDHGLAARVSQALDYPQTIFQASVEICPSHSTINQEAPENKPMHLEKLMEIKGTPLKMATPETAIHLAHRFASPPEQVFRAWLDPALAGQWLFATATRPMTEVSITARVGGQFCFTDGQALHTGRYIHIAEPRELIFSLEDRRTHSRVSVEFTPRGSDCMLSLEQQLPPQYAGFAKQRWHGMFYGLSLLLAGKQPAMPQPTRRNA